MSNDWQPIGTASRASSNEKILATDNGQVLPETFRRSKTRSKKTK